MREVFYTNSCCFELTPLKMGGKNNLESFDKARAGS